MDELHRIKGIGPAFAQTLNHFGIHTFEKLAELTPENLASLMKSRNPKVSPERIEKSDWIGQARALASARVVPEQADLETRESAEGVEGQQVRDVEKSPSETWLELGDFFVSFGYAVGEEGEEILQTRVHHSQEDQHKIWEGLSTQELLDWMITQAGLPSPSEGETPSGSHEGDEAPSDGADSAGKTRLKLTDLLVSETLEATRLDEQVGPATLLHSKARMILTGPEAITLSSDKNPFTIEVYLVNTDNNRSELVASTSGNLTPGAMDYEIQTTFSIPSVGRYQIFVVASLLPPGALTAHLQGPIIRVENQSHKNKKPPDFRQRGF